MQENRAVYADTPAAPAQGHATTGRRANPTISVPAATINRASHSAPGPSASAPAPVGTSRRGRPAGRGRNSGFSAPRSATTSAQGLAGTKRKRYPSSKLKGYFYASGNYGKSELSF